MIRLEAGDHVFVEFVVQRPAGPPAQGYWILARPGGKSDRFRVGLDQSAGFFCVSPSEIHEAPGKRPIVDTDRRVLPGILSFPPEQRDQVRQSIEERVPSLIEDPEVRKLSKRIEDVLVKEGLSWPKTLHAAWEAAGFLSAANLNTFPPADRERQTAIAFEFDIRLRTAMEGFGAEILQRDGTHVDASALLTGSSRTCVAMILGARARAAINQSIQTGR